jgi:hypothetical protein
MYIISVFQSYVRFEVSTAVTMKNAVLWDVSPSSWSLTRRFFYPEDGGDTFLLRHVGSHKI